jgi:ABC-2 type transport system ATP-binding protein
MRSEYVVQTHELTRSFTRRRSAKGGATGEPESRGRRTTLTAVDRLTVDIAEGEAVGYIGANGAGKSTTIKMLVGILVPTSGSVRTCGLEPVRERRLLARDVGVVFGQRSQLWWDLPLGDSFDLLGAIHRLPRDVAQARKDELVDRLEMGPTLDIPVRQLSLGQRMRGEVAAALLHGPRLVILDEPTIGLDVLSKQRLREFLIDQRREHGTTLLLTTHDMGDVSRLCDRVILMDHGRMAFDGTLEGLTAAVGAERVLVVDLAAPTPDLVDLPAGRHLGSEGGGLRQRIGFDPGTTTAAALLAAVSDRCEVLDLAIEEPDIEDVVRRVYLSGRPPDSPAN